MGQLSGFNARVMINGANYGWAEWSFNDTAPALDTTNGEGVTGSGSVGSPGFEGNVPGHRKGTLRVKNATFDTNNSEFESPLSLKSGDVVEALIYPDRDDEFFHNFPAVRLTSVQGEGRIKDLQPISFEGSTDGEYYLIGETA